MQSVIVIWNSKSTCTYNTFKADISPTQEKKEADISSSSVKPIINMCFLVTCYQ